MNVDMLGKVFRDKITGVDGVVIGITYWHFASTDVHFLREGVDSDGQAWPLMTIDSARLVKVKAE